VERLAAPRQGEGLRSPLNLAKPPRCAARVPMLNVLSVAREMCNAYFEARPRFVGGVRRLNAVEAGIRCERQKTVQRRHVR
jgi:hypothetical protein